LFSSLRAFSSTLLCVVGLAIPAIALAQPSVTSVTASDELTVAVTFDQDIDPVSASVVGRYQVFQSDTPSNSFAASSVAVAGPTATLTLASALTGGVNYTLRSQGIQPLGGGSASNLSAVTFDAPFSGSVTPIATIQGDPAGFDGQVVTIEAQVYIPSNYRGTTISGYVQDGSGRGINVFGDEADLPALRDLSAIVRVTGTVTLFFSTVEIANISSVQTLSTGNAPLSPQQITTGAASSLGWEGTFIEVSGTVLSSSQGGPGRNYVVDDGSGSVVVRVVDDLGVATIGDGATLTASGAGGLFGTDFQVNVGLASAISSEGGGGGGGNEDITPIADIQADASNLIGQTFTIEGQVYIPPTSRGGTPSGYIQDDSGRGINLFGSGTEISALQDVTAKVRLTGDVEVFFSTVELENITNVQVLSTGNPPVVAEILDIRAANSSLWEGTYVEVQGDVLSKNVAGSATNYTIDDGTGTLDVRIAPALGLDFEVGVRLYARGAGGAFQTTFQVVVGNSTDARTSPFSNAAPPRLRTAFVTDADVVKLVFSEAVEESSATDVGNYSLSARTGGSAAVLFAELGPATTVTLFLDQEIDVDDEWTVTVNGVTDLDGNTMTAPATMRVGRTDFVLDGPARTFLPREGERYPITMGVPVSLNFTGGGESELLLRVFDLQGRLKATLYDSRFDNASSDFSDGTHTVEWDGRDEFAERVPAGAYIAHLRVVEEETGKTDELQMPVVVAARMQR
jgi:DNA/RNA endonuclease YhcR with UshA esterase domain